MPAGNPGETEVARGRVDLRTPDGVLDVHTFRPAGDGAWPGVILYMDAFGIRPQLAEMGARLAAAGYAVAVPNLYHRTGAFEPFDPKAVFVEGPERVRFKAMIASVDARTAMRDTAAVLDHFSTDPSVRPGAAGAVGYCMGGGYALAAAGTFPDRVGAAASFHGGALATDRPNSPHLLAPRMRAPLYIGVAEIDASFSPEQQARLENALADAGVRYAREVYTGAKHGFAVTGHPVYDRDASERHWRTLLQFFDEHVRGPR
jgi:carboxymethylenebutenolidase